MVLQQMMTTTRVARLFGAETPEEIRTRQGYLAQLRFRRQWHQAGYTRRNHATRTTNPQSRNRNHHPTTPRITKARPSGRAPDTTRRLPRRRESNK